MARGPDGSPPPRRWMLRGLGYVCLGLAAAGLVLPLLPATPFLLAAAWAFARSDPELARRLEQSPRFGPVLLAWRRERAIPRRAKATALLLLAFTGAVPVLTGAGPLVLGVTAVVLTAVAVFILTRPSPSA